jgi:hypothetical protein
MKPKPIFSLCDICAKQINELEPGDVVIWTAGDRKQKKKVLRLLPTPTGNLYTVVMEDSETGRWSVLRLAAERLIGIA